MKPLWRLPAAALPSRGRRGSSSPQYPGLVVPERTGREKPAQSEETPHKFEQHHGSAVFGDLEKHNYVHHKNGRPFLDSIHIWIPNGLGGIGKLRVYSELKMEGFELRRFIQVHSQPTI